MKNPFILTVTAPGGIIPSVLVVAREVLELPVSGDLQIILADGYGDMPDTVFTIKSDQWFSFDRIDLSDINVNVLKEIINSLH